MFTVPGTQKPTGFSRATFAVSAVLHVVAGIGIVYVTQADATPARPLFHPHTSRLVYVEVVPVEIPAIKLAEFPLPSREIVKADEPAPLLPTPEVAPIFESRRAELVKPVELPIEPPPTPAPTPAPRKPEVTVGAFATPSAPARIPEPARQIEIAGFERATEHRIEAKPSSTTAAVAFDRQTDNSVRQELVTPSAISDAGFNRSSIVMSAVPQGRMIRETGFGPSTSLRAGNTSREQPRVADPSLEVTPVTFDRGRAAQKAAHADVAPVTPRITPVEVLSKPTPVYTEEARRLRIEGDVLLEVEFSSAGTIRILRVVRGLGHGLDEAAVQAAQQIRFKPALDSGQAVDSRVTVNIIFRLA